MLTTRPLRCLYNDKQSGKMELDSTSEMPDNTQSPKCYINHWYKWLQKRCNNELSHISGVGIIEYEASEWWRLQEKNFNYSDLSDSNWSGIKHGVLWHETSVYLSEEISQIKIQCHIKTTGFFGNIKNYDSEWMTNVETKDG